VAVQETVLGSPRRYRPHVVAEPTRSFADGVVLRWRGPLADAEMAELIESYGGSPVAGWWDDIRPHSLGWVTARTGDGEVVGFVNVATDGGDHAFLIDTRTRGSHQRRGIGVRVVAFAAEHAKAAGCEWLHVDFEPGLRSFYFEACGFRPTDAGLIHLPSL
jgi:GNAT superfamily N-acetyltransferase